MDDKTLPLPATFSIAQNDNETEDEDTKQELQVPSSMQKDVSLSDTTNANMEVMMNETFKEQPSHSMNEQDIT